MLRDSCRSLRSVYIIVIYSTRTHAPRLDKFSRVCADGQNESAVYTGTHVRTSVLERRTRRIRLPNKITCAHVTSKNGNIAF